MRYLIITNDIPPFVTNWFSVENNYTEGMIVYDLSMLLWTKDGKCWNPITEDHL